MDWARAGSASWPIAKVGDEAGTGRCELTVGSFSLEAADTSDRRSEIEGT